MKNQTLHLEAFLHLSEDVDTKSAANSLEVLRHFSAAVNNGLQPDDRVMKAIAEVFANYFCQHQIAGESANFKSLDEIFNLKLKQGVGHPIKQHVSASVRNMFLTQICQHRLSAKSQGETPTLMESAEWVSDNWKINGESMDAETLKRYYTDAGGDRFFLNKAQAFENYMEI